MNSAISNYTQVKEKTLGGTWQWTHIGSVLVQCSRKWDRDHKQIQITAIALEIVADQLCKLNIATGFGSVRNRKGIVLLENMWWQGGARGLLSSEKYDIEIGLVVAPGIGDNQNGIGIVSKGDA